ncbi:DUF6059 family protein [Streptomyces sp. NPDC059862]|uniref:DUF6059 family protein n=1 Tax=unclassified Streptomyces TaxID=2593676 RepID=UPI00363B34ED
MTTPRNPTSCEASTDDRTRPERSTGTRADLGSLCPVTRLGDEGASMKRFEGRMRAWPISFLRMAWHSLVCLGAFHTGPIVYHYAVPRPASAPSARGPFARHTPGGLTVAAGGPCVLPPGHPERVCADMPLSEAEQRMARELWPVHGQGSPKAL